MSASFAAPAAGTPSTPATPERAAAPLSPPEGVIPDLNALGWQPVLNEDFAGTTLDESLWHTAHGTDWKGIVVPEAVSVGGGNLTMSVYTANGENYGGSIATGYFGSHNPTWAGFDAAYGYAEARIKLPDGPGTYNAFWTETANNIDRPFDDPAASGPEIDIMEHSSFGGDVAPADGVCDWPDHLEAQGIPCSETLLNGGHWNGFEEDHKVLHTMAVKNPVWDPTNATTKAATSLEGNFHTYGLLWTPDGYRYFLDGVETFRTPALGATYFPENFILSGTVSNEPPWDAQDYGPLGAATNEKTLVDYVKVWQRPISEVPDQTVVADRPVTVPFTVTDYNFSSLTKAEPGSIRVAATSSVQSVVPDGNIVVTGNGPTDPDGNFDTKGTFDGTPVGWTFPDLNGATSGTGNNAQVWTTRKYAGTKALHLSEVNADTTQKGRAQLAITGLQANTTYQVGMRYDLEIGFVDNDGDGVTEPTDGNGRVDPGEPFTETGETETDGTARFDLGVVDVDASRSGNQEAKVVTTRNGYQEAGNPSWWKQPTWPEEMLQFTTGSSTTSVTLFVSNEAYVGTQDDADVTVDSMWLRALVPAQRAVTLRPNTTAEGSTVITLTATNAAGTVLTPSEQFTVNFKRGSTFANGNFDAAPLGTGWLLSGGDPKNGRGAQVVVDNPFQLDRMLQLAAPVTTEADGFPILPATHGVATQYISGLTAGTVYSLSITGKGDFDYAVQEHAGAGSHVDGHITSSSWTTPLPLTFTPTGTTAKLVLVDWSGSNGASFADDITLTAAGSPGPVSFTAPALAGVGEQRIPSDAPAAIPFTQATSNNSTITVTSDNPLVLPTANVRATRVNGVDQKVLALTPLRGRTGKATVGVTYTDATGPHTVNIPVVVSDGRLLNPGFEGGLLPWTTTANAISITGRSGSGLQIDATSGLPAGVTQIVGVPENTRTECRTRFTVAAWAKGNAKLTVRQPQATGYTPAPLATLTWANPASWTEQKATFTAPGCFEHDTSGNVTKSFEVLLEDTNTAAGAGALAQFDDLSVVHAPAIRSIRDISLHSGQTSWQWDTRRDVSVGRIAANSFYDSGVVSVSSSDQTVLPNASIERRLTDSGWQYLWWLGAKAGTKTGRSTVTLQLSDPFTGVTTKSFDVTVNAGTSFNNGDFERGLGGWVDPWCFFGCSSWNTQVKRSQGPWNPPPTDYDNALRFANGVVSYRITGLAANTDYRLSLSALGTGSTVAVRDTDNVFAGNDLQYQGSPSVATINSPWTGYPPTTWPTYNVTFNSGANGDNIYIVLIDGDATGAAVDSDDQPCTIHEAGETCFDDLGVFKLTDL